jgi:hypothetical protein
MPVRTNATTLALTEQTALDTLPGSPVWEYLEPNDITTFGATISTVARNPISNQRARRKGTVVDLNSAVAYNADLTLSQFLNLAQGFLFSTFTDVGDSGQGVFAPTAVTATGYTVAANGDLSDGYLIFARGFSNPENNGLKVTAGTSTTTEVKAAGLVAEGSPPAGARLEVVGFRTATGDLDVDASGNLTSTALDMTTLGLTVGQAVFVGGDAAANQFTNAENAGIARVVSIAAGELVIEKKEQAFVLEANTTQDVDLYFGPFLRDVPVTDASFAQRWYQLEARFDGLTDIDPAYEYAINNNANEMTIQMPLTDKVTVAIGLIGTDTEVPTGSRKSGSFVDPVQTEALNTTNDFATLRVQDSAESALSTYFKSLNLVINNGIQPEKVLANLGAIDMNYGEFAVTGNAELLFTHAAIVDAIRSNDTVGMDFTLRNGDGGVVFDMPSVTLGNGGKTFPRNESVRIQIEGNAFLDPAIGYSFGITHFGFMPSI